MDNTAALILEESIADPRNQKLTTFTKNITLNKLMTVEETCEYSPAAENSNWFVPLLPCQNLVL